MSMAWEVTQDDIAIVLDKHEVIISDEELDTLHDLIMCEESRIEDAALSYDDIDDQADSALDEIENILMEEGIIVGDKLFVSP